MRRIPYRDPGGKGEGVGVELENSSEVLDMSESLWKFFVFSVVTIVGR